MKNFKRSTLALSILIALLAVTGCGEAKNTETPYGEKKIAENGMKYVLTCLEGKKFIAYQTSYNYWHLSGPVADCDS